MEELELNLMETYPDDTWTVLYEDKISGGESIDSNSTIAQYINLLNEKNISYVSYFSDNMTGGRHPKYTNKFRLFVKADEIEYLKRDYLVEKGLLLDKTIEEIEEFKDVDMDEELTAEDFSTFNKMFLTIIGVFLIVFLWGGAIFFVYLSTQVSSGKIALIIIAILFAVFAFFCTKPLFASKNK